MALDLAVTQKGSTMSTTPSPGGGSTSFIAVDIVVLVLYFMFVLAVGFWSMCRTKRSTVDGYFLAGKSMTWWPVGASLFSSNIGSGHLIGLAGSGAAAGIGAIAYEWNVRYSKSVTHKKRLQRASPCSKLACCVVTGNVDGAAAGVDLSAHLSGLWGDDHAGIFTEAIWREKNALVHSRLVLVYLHLHQDLSQVDMYAGALFIKLALQWDIYLAVVLLLSVTSLYTIAGGLAAVIYTDAAQTVIMLAGALILMGFSFAKVGGWNALMEGYLDAIPSVRVPNTTCGIPREDSFHVFRDPVDSDLPWPGVLIGMSLPSMWYWCSDQVIVQRSLAAKTLTHAKGGSLLASYLKILPFFTIMLPGMISRILYTDEVACADPELCKQICDNPAGCTDTAYARLVMELLPAGLRGLMMAVMIAALVSSLTSVFNSASTIFTMDLWKTFRSAASEWELMIVGRVFVLVMVVASIFWIPVIQASQGGQLFIYIQSISTYLQPPVSVIFLLGCFWTRTNEKGAFWGMVVGLTVGCTRMLLDFIYPAPLCFEQDDRPAVVKSVHYLYFSTLLSFITLAVAVPVSLATEKPKAEQIHGLTWFTRCAPIEAKEPPLEEVTGHQMERKGKEEDHTRKDSSGSRSGVRHQSRLASALYWLCGMERREKEAERSPATPVAPDLSQLKENPCLKQVVNANLIVCLSVAAFIIGYWA
ncbi:sodium/myo-inositol cotransporter 2 isoform X1 [Phyllopteryx taeniolatus]|uniref:sodium/myo-inositol cotransporter 2 isoform X1 n=1 Tax=Phyllopteryx taeniolatus TaxID=161469 RepID=UPI002AD3C096|nr:sodium/myo-inositol cotransporter 2 isoform X1 [Phyllopteryx taeniolatus]